MRNIHYYPVHRGSTRDLTTIRLLFVLFLAMASFHTLADPYRILHVMSYHSGWQWNKDQFEGFKSELRGIDVEYQVIELDTKRISDEAQILSRVAQAKTLVESWQPHLIYTNDDNAQQYFARDFIDHETPLVFSGVNRAPSEYDFVGSSNITGVLEQEHFVATVKLLQRIKPEIRKIAVIADKDPTWKGVMARMRFDLRMLPNIEVIDWTIANSYADYQTKVLALQSEADALAILGVFNLADAQGNNVDYEQVLKWTVENSKLPDFSFWNSRVERGTLCAVTVSGFEQGVQAGKLAYQILQEHKSPSRLPMRTSSQGRPAISLARARNLGLRIDAELLLNTDVTKEFAWNR